MFTIYTSDAYQQESNCTYPHPVQVTDEASFRREPSRTTTCAPSTGTTIAATRTSSPRTACRSTATTTTQRPGGLEDAYRTSRKALPGVFFAVHYSRHNNVPKDEKSARPRFHLFFQIDPMKSYEAYAALKQLLHDIFPYLDANALDAARFLYGTSEPGGRVPSGRQDAHGLPVSATSSTGTCRAATRSRPRFRRAAGTTRCSTGQYAP
jgi:hypothetical protein